MGRGTLAVVVLVIALAFAPGAQAAKTVGSSLEHDADATVCPAVLLPTTDDCTDAIAGLGAGAAEFGPTVPSAGMITAWRIKRGDEAFDIRAALRVIRAGTAVGTSAQETLPGAAGTYEFPARLLVRPGDQIGVDLRQVPFDAPVTVAHSTGDGADLLDEWAPQLGTGASTPPTSDDVPGVELLLQVDVEPDADGDDFGDETQDACPTDAATQDPCPAIAPETRITKAPKRRLAKPKASVSFTSTADGASFQCSLDGVAYSSCSSPWKLRRLGTGEHFVLVRAIAAGLPDPTPARADFTVQKKKRR